MTPLCNMLAEQASRHGITIRREGTLQTCFFLADDSPIIAKSAESAVLLYDIAEEYCRVSGVQLHPDKRIPILVIKRSQTHLSNGVRVLPSGKAETILGVPAGCDITWEQMV